MSRTFDKLAVADRMRRYAKAHPLAYADLDPTVNAVDVRFFGQPSREVTWGLTLNKVTGRHVRVARVARQRISYGTVTAASSPPETGRDRWSTP